MMCLNVRVWLEVGYWGGIGGVLGVCEWSFLIINGDKVVS